MKGVTHNVERVLKSPLFVVITALVLIGALATAVSGLTLTSYTKVNTLIYGVVQYHGDIYFDSYATDYLGDPLTGTNVTVDLFNAFENSNIKTIGLVTNSSGYANCSLGSAANLTQDMLTATVVNGTYFGMFPVNIGGTEILLNSVGNSTYGISSFREGPTSFYSEPLIVYFNQSGSPSPPINVFISSTYYSTNTLGTQITHSIEKGPFSNFSKVDVPVQFGNYSVQYASITVNTVSNNTTLAGTSAPLYSLPPGYSLMVSFLGLVPAYLGFFIVLLGLYAVTVTYAKDETSGAIEIAMSKKITRRQLLLQRYFSSALVMSGLILGFVGLLYLIFLMVIKSSLPLGFATSLLFGLLIPTLSIMAFPFMFGRMRRMREAIGVLILFGVLIAALAIDVVISTYSSPGKVPWYLASLPLFSPINFYALFLNAFYPGLASYSGIDLVPAGIYPNPAIIVASGVLWVVLPILGFYYFANRRY